MKTNQSEQAKVLEEAAEHYQSNVYADPPFTAKAFIAGAQWQQSQPGIKQCVSEDQLINAAKYGYEYHRTTQFPDLSFNENCRNNFLQFLQGQNSTTTPQSDMVSKEKVIEILEQTISGLSETTALVRTEAIQECITKIKQI